MIKKAENFENYATSQETDFTSNRREVETREPGMSILFKQNMIQKSKLNLINELSSEV